METTRTERTELANKELAELLYRYAGEGAVASCVQVEVDYNEELRLDGPTQD